MLPRRGVVRRANRRGHVLFIRVTPREHARFVRSAKRAKLPTAVWARRTLHSAILRGAR